MSWFGGGSKNSSSSESSGSLSDHGGSGGFPEDYSATGSSIGGGAGGSVQQQFQQFAVELQQQVMIQKAVTELTGKAFQQCIVPSIRPSSSAGANLAGRDVACIHSVVNKWLDTNELLLGRLANKMQAGANGQQ